MCSLVVQEDGCCKCARTPFSLSTRDVQNIQPVEVGGSVANAPQVLMHFGDGGGIWADASLAAGFDDSIRGLKGVQRIDSVLREYIVSFILIPTGVGLGSGLGTLYVLPACVAIVRQEIDIALFLICREKEYRLVRRNT